MLVIKTVDGSHWL